RATREAVTVVDETSFGKFLMQGRDAESSLQRLCTNDIAVPVGRTVYTGLLNERGTYESDLTIARLAATQFLIITGSAQVTRDADWIERNLPQGTHAVLADITGAWTVLSVMGPQSRKLLQKVSRADFSNEAFPFATIREIGVGYATVLASRRTYMGELGWELYVPVEFAVTVFETLHAAGGEVGLRDMGYYAIEGLRIEKAYRAWGRELTPDDTPWQADGCGVARRGKVRDRPRRRAAESQHRLARALRSRRRAHQGLSLFQPGVGQLAGGFQDRIGDRRQVAVHALQIPDHVDVDRA